MIKTKDDLRRYLEEDKKALGKIYSHPAFMTDEVWRYEIALRHREYYINQNSGFRNKIMKAYWTFVHHRKSVQLGLQVPPNICEPGLHINHYGLLVISPVAHIGSNFNVHQGVNIGMNIVQDKAPWIGDNVFCGPGVKIFGDVRIADNIAISAGSVVNKSFTTPNVTIGGVPAKIINEHKGNPFV